MIAPFRGGPPRAAGSILLSVVLAGSLAAASAIVAAPGAGALPPKPPWEPIGNPPEAGGLLFFNSSGTRITGGSTTTAPLAAYVQGTSILNSTDDKATLEAYTPVKGVSPGQWTGTKLSSSTVYPNSGAPSDLKSSPLPLVTGSSGDTTIATYIKAFPNKAVTSTFEDLYVLRVVTSNPVQTTDYDEAVIKVTGTTWTVVYPTSAISVSTNLSSPRAYGTEIQLKVTLTPPTVTGTVQFTVGSPTPVDIGSPVAVTSGHATLTTSALPVGTDIVGAAFTSTGSNRNSIGSTLFTVTKASTTTTLTSTPAHSQTFGQRVTLTATISPSTATGTVQFKNGTTNIGTPVTVSAGKAITFTSALPVGTDSLKALFTSTSSDYNGSTGTETFMVNKITTTTTLTTVPVSPQYVGTSIKLTATITPSTGPGEIQFKDGTSNIGNSVLVSAGKASFTTTLPAGTDHLKAVFTPSTSNYTTSTGTTTFDSESLRSTTTTLTSTPAHSQTFGQRVTLTATISPSTATGTVQFKNGTTNIGTPVTVSAGKAITFTSALPVGTDHLKAVFTPTPGDGYNGSTGTETFTVNKITTTTTLTTTPVSPQHYKTSIKLTAAVAPATTGSVQFKDGTSVIGSPVTVSAGKASISTSTLPVGTDHLSAVFTPTSTHYAGSTGVATFHVTPIPTTTKITTSPLTPVYAGTTMTLTATVTPSSAPGTVQFKEGSTDVGSPVAVSAGRAVLSTSALPVGSYTLKAVFTPGTGDYSGSTGTTPFEVKPLRSTTTGLTASPASPQFSGTAVTLKATVTPSTATGTVQFKVGATDIGSPVALSAGKASISTSSLPVGTDTLSAVFAPTTGNGYAGSTGTGQFTVKPLVATQTALTTSPASPQLSGTAVTLKATVTPSTATGSVQFKVGATDIGSPVALSAGKASISTSSLPVGTDTLSAVFAPTTGNGYSGSTGTTPFVVRAASSGYDLVGADGGVFVFNPPGVTGGFYGSLPGDHVVPNAPVVGLVPTKTAQGYFLVGSDGGVFSFGNAPFLGSLPGLHITPGAPIVGIVATDTDRGYDLVGADGGVYAFGTAPFLGSLPGGQISTRTVIGIAATPSGDGYWVVLATGKVYAFGTAKAFTTSPTTSRVTAIAGTPTGGGYWLVTTQGGVYPYGNAKKQGSGTLPSLHVVPNRPVIGIVPTAGTTGYWLIGLDGGIYAFGTAPYYGSLPGLGVSVADIVGAVPN